MRVRVLMEGKGRWARGGRRTHSISCRVEGDEGLPLPLGGDQDVVEGTVAREQPLQQLLTVATVGQVGLLGLPRHLRKTQVGGTHAP